MSNIKGIGVDLIEIERVRESIDRHGSHFIDRLFSEKEKEHCAKFKDPIPHFAGRFAAKEAIAKALGLGFGKEVKWKDLEILPDKNGKPIVSFSKDLKTKFSIESILISISHSQSHATAFAIWV